MDKNNEQKNNKTPEMKPKQDSFRPWLKLIPAAAVFAAVCVTCYQADKSPVETTSVSNNNVMSTDEIKELISQGTAGKDFDSEDSSETNGTSISKTSKGSFLYLIFKISSDRTITLPPSYPVIKK